MTTTYQSMCTDLLKASLCNSDANGQKRAILPPQQSSDEDTASFSIHGRGVLNKTNGNDDTTARLRQGRRGEEENSKGSEPIPLYFAWNRLDGSDGAANTSCIKEKQVDDGPAATKPVQIVASPAFKEPISATKKTSRRPAPPQCQHESHYFFVAPDLANDEPNITEYADKYRYWSKEDMPKQNHTPAFVKKGSKSARKGNRYNNDDNDVDGVGLALQGTSIVQTPRLQRNTKAAATPASRHAKSSTHSASSSVKAKREQPPALVASTTPRPSPTSNNTGQHFTPRTKPSRNEERHVVDQSPQIMDDFKENEFEPYVPTAVAALPTPTPQKKEHNDLRLIASGGNNTSRTPMLPNEPRPLREKRRDMPFWKSSQGNAFGIHKPTTPLQPKRRGGGARRFGERAGGSMACTSKSSACSTTRTPQKQAKMLMTTRRGLSTSSTRLFPRLPDDPFSRRAYTRKI